MMWSGRILARSGLALFATLAGACSRPPSLDGVALRAPVLFVSIDTLRSDRLPAYGFRGVETPAIDRLAEEGITFDFAYSHVPLTLPSHISALSGTLPSRHGVHDNLGYPLDSARIAWLPRLLREHGYATAAAVSAYVLRTETGVSDGFDRYDDEIPLSVRGGLGTSQRSCSETLRAATPFLDRTDGRPFFLFLHFYEPHSPHSPPPDSAHRYADPYLGEIAAVDACVAALLDSLRARSLYERSLIVLFSDHGESLGEHGELEHGILLHRAVLQVPLIVKLPGGSHGGERIRRPAALIDLLPTVTALAGLATPSGLDGAALLSSSPPDDRRAIVAETLYPRLHFGWSDLHSVIRFPRHLIDGPVPELYDLERDPAELDDLASGERRQIAELRKALADPVAVLPPVGEADDETRSRLAALGYLGGSSVLTPGPLPNPKAGIGSLQNHARAVEALARRNFTVAAASLDRLVAANPRMVDAWELLGTARERLGQWEAAEAAFREAARLSGGASSPTLALASLFASRGRLEEAEQQARLAANASPTRATLLLGEIALRRGDVEAAEQAGREALALGGDPAGAWLLLARSSQARADLDQALERCERALAVATRAELVPPGLHLLRADLLARLGRAQESLAEFALEIESFPADPAAYTRLAALQAALEQPDAARRTLQRLLAANPESPLARAEASRAHHILGLS
ncbi:MAG: sulfatase-like hydrolase/transferase [Thermoanaerobaculia bacterium]